MAVVLALHFGLMPVVVAVAVAPRESPDPERGPKIHLFGFGDNVSALVSQ